MANLACYLAVAVPNGFTPRGTLGSINFFARLFGECELFALAKTYQDAAACHKKHPKLDETS